MTTKTSNLAPPVPRPSMRAWASRRAGPVFGATVKYRCRQCRRLLSREQFRKSSVNKSGIRHECKNCSRTNDAAYRRAHSEEIRAYFQKYRLSRASYFHTKSRQWRIAHRDLANAIERRYNAEHPGAEAARHAVGRAIRGGQLVKKPCEVCGNPHVHGHHDDYAKRLGVRWLCCLHHRRLHASTRAAAEAARSKP
jgi:hypothetical protein